MNAFPCPLCGNAKQGDVIKRMSEHLKTVRVYVQDCIERGHDRATLGNMFSARDEIDAALAGKDPAGEKAGLTQASDSLARISSSHPVREDIVERWRERLQRFNRIKGAGIPLTEVAIALNDISGLLDEIERLRSSHPEDGGIREALEKFLAKYDLCEPAIIDAFAFRQNHGGTYRGPNYEKELADLRAALNPAPLPIGEEK